MDSSIPFASLQGCFLLKDEQLSMDSAGSGMTEEIMTSSVAPSESTESANTVTSSPDVDGTDMAEEDKPQRRVNFDTIMIREYDRTLGDNPATTHGPPLALDWEYEDAYTIKVDEYEEQRAPRRITHQMMIPGNIRENILLTQTPTTKQQIQSMISQVRSSRHKRQTTVAMQDFEEWHEAFEFISRRFRRFRKGITKEKEQELLWEQAHHYQTTKTQQKLQKDAASEDSTDDGCADSAE